MPFDSGCGDRGGRHGLSSMRQLGILGLCLLLAPAVAAAGNMRCGSSVIENGLTFFEVLERCGRPDLEYAWDEDYVPGVEARITEWVYEQGVNKFRRVLRFENGRLREIEMRSHPKAPIDSVL